MQNILKFTNSCAAYHAFMSGRLIVFEKQPGVSTVRVGETWIRLFARIGLKVTGPETTMACQGVVPAPDGILISILTC